MPIMRLGKESDRKPNRSLTPDQVREIRRRAVREPYPRLAKIFGVSASAIGLVYRRETYQDVDPPKGGVSPTTPKSAPTYEDAVEALFHNEAAIKLPHAAPAKPHVVNEGDIVQLRTGDGPKMTVNHVDVPRKIAHVTWWDRGTICSSHAPIASLQKVA